MRRGSGRTAPSLSGSLFPRLFADTRGHPVSNDVEVALGFGVWVAAGELLAMGGSLVEAGGFGGVTTACARRPSPRARVAAGRLTKVVRHSKVDWRDARQSRLS